MGIIFNGIFCLQMVNNLDWFTVSPGSLQYELKWKNVAQAFSYVHVPHNYTYVFSYVKAYATLTDYFSVFPEANLTVMYIKLVFNLKSPTYICVEWCWWHW